MIALSPSQRGGKLYLFAINKQFIFPTFVNELVSIKFEYNKSFILQVFSNDSLSFFKKKMDLKAAKHLNI